MIKFKSPVEAFLHWERIKPDEPFLIQPIDRKLINYSYKEAGIEIRKIAAKLKGFGFSEKSHIALLSKNCAHWQLSDLAIMMAQLYSGRHDILALRNCYHGMGPTSQQITAQGKYRHNVGGSASSSKHV